MTSKISTSVNTILGGAVTLHQPTEGYRASIDPLFLAASIQARPGHRVLDLGTGVGTAMLALGHRLSEITVTGLELQEALCALAQRNITENHFTNRLDVVCGNLVSPTPILAPQSFDHVMANPPYYESAKAPASPNTIKAQANHDQGYSLDAWVACAARFVKPRGYVTFIFPADRVDDLILAFSKRFGGLTLFPLWPKEGLESKRVILQGRRDVQTPARLLPGLVIHNADGSYTPGAEAVLRRGKRVSF